MPVLVCVCERARMGWVCMWAARIELGLHIDRW
jgi:hypothetical protein